jgi:peptidoglycan/LPS O-acetylase OafA/YrhL
MTPSAEIGTGGVKIGAVNGLRGVAILLVILHHFFIPFTRQNPLHPGVIDSESFFAAFVNNAFLGVNIFFVLSGFVLYLPYRAKRRSIDRLADFPSFYWHRSNRLLPLYYIVVLVTVALHAKSAAGSNAWYLELGGLLSTLFIFSAHGFMPPSNIVLWSVGVEIWFSLLFPALVLLIGRWSIERVLLASLVVCAAFIFAGSLLPVERVGVFRPFTSGIFGSCYQFVLGMFVCHLYLKGANDAALRRLHSHMLLPGALLISVALYLMHHGPWLTGQVLGSMLFCIGFASLLLGLLSGRNPIRRLLEIWPLQLLGCMCYSIYAWHGIAMNAMIPPETSTLSGTLRLSAPYFLVTIALSALSYRYIEFGRERNWKALFLIRETSPKPVAVKHMLPTSNIQQRPKARELSGSDDIQAERMQHL